jgi:ATP-binding cassette subfamily F protein 3
VEKAPNERKVQAQETFQARKTVSKEIRKIQNRVDYLEKEIGKLEKRQAAIEKVLAAPGKDDDVMELTREYLENKRSLDAFTEEWSVQMEKLDN